MHHPVSHPSKRYRAFTLAELLVVITILIVLIAILLPLISRARRTAKETLCATRIRTLCTAVTLFSYENNGWLPNMGTNSEKVFDGGEPRPYYISSFYRDYFISRYHVRRETFYSPTNDLWNRDDFWFANPTIIGYTYFGNRPSYNSSILSQIQATNPSAFEPLFARKITDAPFFPHLVTDMNRQWPIGSFVTPADPLRWGANHLYVKQDKIESSHVGALDGSVTRIPGSDLKARCDYNSVRYFW